MHEPDLAETFADLRSSVRRWKIAAGIALILWLLTILGGIAILAAIFWLSSSEAEMSRQAATKERAKAEAALREAEFAMALAQVNLADAGVTVAKPSGVSSPQPDTPPQPDMSPGLGDDDRKQQLAVGTWEDDYQGHRTMTLNPDGTGTMMVELDGMKATLFAPRLRFDMEWSVDGERLRMQTIGGEPAVQVQLILKTMGDRVVQNILDLTEDRLRLLDADGQTEYDWRRVDDPAGNL